MRAPGDLLLVSCYELGHQPLSLASPVATLQAAGFEPVAVDTSVEPLTEAAIRRARLVAISVPMLTALRLGVEVARRVRALNPEAHIAAYGLYATLNADYLFERGLADSVIGGEFETPLLGLVEALARGDRATVAGVGRPGHPAEPALAKVSFQVPARSGLPEPARYAHLVHEDANVPAGYVEATRGCLHTCRHCPVVPIYGGRLFAVPREIVLADIRQQVAAGAGHITFGDPDFLNGPGHVLRIVRAMRAEHPHLTFDATIKIEHILQHRTIFPELADLGCAFIVSAVESVSDVVLGRIAKGHTRADIEVALDILDAAGIPMRPSLLPFTPWTTLEDYVELLAFIERRDLLEHVDPVHLSIRLLVPPGSALLDEPETAEWLGPLDAAAFTYTWVHRDPRVDQLQRDVAALVEAADAGGRPVVETFGSIRALALGALGLAPLAARPVVAPRRRPPPRLSESWFC